MTEQLYFRGPVFIHNKTSHDKFKMGVLNSWLLQESSSLCLLWILKIASAWTFLCGLLDVLNVPPWVLSGNAVSFNSPKNMQVGFLDESRPKV